jgi:murein DD-endopeptidase MepM/ murein hydrolase activator NlpD
MLDRRVGRGVGVFSLVAPAALSSGIAIAASQVVPPASAPEFLALPFRDPGVTHGQGWYYERGAPVPPVTCPHPNGDLRGWKTHCGHDYRKIVRGRGHQTFQVLAAASGRARRYNAGSGGHYVAIEHDRRAPNGELICTRYLHLDPKRIVVPSGRWMTVKGGQLLGWAGRSGTKTIHLHFDVRIGGCDSWHPRVDPYDIAGALIRARMAPTREHYPGYPKFAGCGRNALWIRCPSKG